LLLVLGCKRDQLLDDIIPTEQVSSILTDLQIAGIYGAE
jgi:hypothetical protein